MIKLLDRQKHIGNLEQYEEMSLRVNAKKIGHHIETIKKSGEIGQERRIQSAQGTNIEISSVAGNNRRLDKGGYKAASKIPRGQGQNI